MFSSSCFAVALLAVAVVVPSVRGDWTIKTHVNLTTDLGIAFVNRTHGFTAGDANGVGPEIFKTTDGGDTWENVPANFGIDVLLLAMAASHESVVITSVFGEMFSTDDGQHWLPSIGGGTSQSVRAIAKGDGKHFGVAGQFGKREGVAVSDNGGQTFHAMEAGLSTEARYAAYPTDDVWYVSAGQWPEDGKPRHPKRRSELQHENGTWPTHFEPKAQVGDGYMAQISKTEDGGKTWNVVYSDLNSTFYFNGIDCFAGHPDNCCAVGEASGSADSGARIYCTADGGKNWNRTFYAPATSEEHFSLMDIRYVTPTELWAIGGDLHRVAPSAWFLHSTDGGATWQHSVTPMLGFIALGFDFVDPGCGYAVIENVITQTAAIAKYTA
eukprot:m.483263 g.483263  ORF g.483263 m.483263 type:complete len:383 (+) comp22851_c0_seq1:121-1269(+)